MASSVGKAPRGGLEMGSRRWIRGPAWDIGCIALPWLPLALLLLLGLDDIHVRPGSGDGGLAMLFLGLAAMDMGHRLYTFPVAYADRSVFRRHRLKLLLAPLLVAAVVIPIRHFQISLPLARGLATFMVLWNVWHVFMQRLGFLRIYGGKLGGSLREPAAARLDRLALWSLVACTVVVGVATLGDAALSTGDSRRIAAFVGPLLGEAVGWVALAVVAFALAVVVTWIRQERRVTAGWPERAPRTIFAASTAGLILLPLVSPVVGVACLKFSHAVEYIAFVHHYEAAKFERLEDERGAFARLMRRPWLAVPLLFLLFCVLYGWADLPAYVAMLVAPLHFLFDGWIWKVGDREVRAPLGG